ncbi:hypothetical protein BD779DRAFT_1670949 [Infundibulicybe gibba]|nr:hypothetical protein BD779DRAFT_1670949 [Infundibulicybe gibba]
MSGGESSPSNASSESVNTPNGQRLPRLMSVVTTFTPNLEDELEVRLGDTVRMIDEYHDGWCLVQRVGRIDAPRGVIPRFCLHERRDIVPRNPTAFGSAISPSRR